MVTFFTDYFATMKGFSEFCNNVLKHDVKVDNRESCLGNEGKDMKQQIFSPLIISNISTLETHKL